MTMQMGGKPDVLGVEMGMRRGMGMGMGTRWCGAREGMGMRMGWESGEQCVLPCWSSCGYHGAGCPPACSLNLRPEECALKEAQCH